MILTRINFSAALAALVLLAHVALPAASLEGRVLSVTGDPVFGASVTLTNSKGYSESVYSNPEGRWRLQTELLHGEVTLRARAPDFADAQESLVLAPSDRRRLTLTLGRFGSPADLAASFSASAHAATVPWRDAGVQHDFISQCHFCHQIGNAWTRKDGDEDQWRNTINRMQGYGAVLTWDNEREFRRTLAHGFSTPARARSVPEDVADLGRTRFREWAFGDSLSYVHDIEPGRDGRLYGVDMSNDALWIVDPRSNAIERVEFPHSDLPLGGMFSGGVAPLGTFAARHGPHSIVLGPDGRFYITCSLAGEIGIYDPQARSFEFLPVGGDAIYPHTLRFDRNGVLWFTLALSNQIGRFDPGTKQFTLIDLPANGAARWFTDAMLPGLLKVASWFGKKDLYVTLSHHKLSGQGHRIFNLPYGLDIDPVDGSVWYSKVYADRIGRVDPQTRAVTEYSTPHAGPRRMRFDASGILWIPSFGEGQLMKFDPRSGRFLKSYALPTPGPGEYETPYALNVHPQTQQIWITANMTDRMLRFDPETERFMAYPSPTRTTFPRDVVFLPDGSVCSSNSNLPSASIEGGRPKMFCIEPDASPGAIAARPPLH